MKGKRVTARELRFQQSVRGYDEDEPSLCYPYLYSEILSEVIVLSENGEEEAIPPCGGLERHSIFASQCDKNTAFSISEGGF